MLHRGNLVLRPCTCTGRRRSERALATRRHSGPSRHPGNRWMWLNSALVVEVPMEPSKGHRPETRSTGPRLKGFPLPCPEEPPRGCGHSPARRCPTHWWSRMRRVNARCRARLNSYFSCPRAMVSRSEACCETRETVAIICLTVNSIETAFRVVLPWANVEVSTQFWINLVATVRRHARVEELAGRWNVIQA